MTVSTGVSVNLLIVLAVIINVAPSWRHPQPSRPSTGSSAAAPCSSKAWRGGGDGGSARQLGPGCDRRSKAAIPMEPTGRALEFITANGILSSEQVFWIL